jgi:hypothetical protein
MRALVLGARATPHRAFRSVAGHRPRHAQAGGGQEELEEAGLMDPKNVGVTFYRRADLRSLGSLKTD